MVLAPFAEARFKNIRPFSDECIDDAITEAQSPL